MCESIKTAERLLKLDNYVTQGLLGNDVTLFDEYIMSTLEEVSNMRRNTGMAMSIYLMSITVRFLNLLYSEQGFKFKVV